MRTVTGIIVLIALLVAACASDDDGQARTLTVVEAVDATGDNVTVTGFLVATQDGKVVLAEVLAESFPPQAGGATITVIGLDLTTITELQSAQGVSWTDNVISLTGSLANGVLSIG